MAIGSDLNGRPCHTDQNLIPTFCKPHHLLHHCHHQPHHLRHLRHQPHHLGHQPHHLRYQPVAGVIGASFSGVSIMVANILKLFRVSLVDLTDTNSWIVG